VLRNKRKESVWSVSRFGRFFFVGSSFSFVLFVSQKFPSLFFVFFALLSIQTLFSQRAPAPKKSINSFF
jgi:hypothetical protein